MTAHGGAASGAAGLPGGRLRLGTLALVVVATLAGVILGLLVTISSLDLDVRGQRSGIWRSLPREGSGTIDPYSLAADDRAGLLPLGESEGLGFVARTDGAGRALDGGCDYALRGPMPVGRFWTVSLLDPAGFPVADPAKRYGFTSAAVLRFEGEPIALAISPEARAGNWLPTGGARRFVLMLRLYDTSLTGGGTDFAALKMPSLERLSCR